MTAGDELAALASLAGLPGMGPRRMAALLAEWAPTAAWEAICAGRLRLEADGGTAFPGRQLARLGRIWADASRHCRPDQLLERCSHLGIEVLPYGSARYPRRLRRDPEPPLVLFARGELGALDAPTAAVVGTRRASRYGLDAATELAGDLADAAVAVVSGLAVGIDAAAHVGALRAGGAAVVGVVGSGLDVVYPRRPAGLWSEVANRGLLLSEAPPGTPPEPWRFPARNRIIAGLSQVVVVVESPARGGSIITAEEAFERELPVLAVPGSIRSPLSEGTNTLLCNGGIPVRSADDVLIHLGWPGGSGCGPRRPSRRRSALVAPAPPLPAPPLVSPPPRDRPDRQDRQVPVAPRGARPDAGTDGRQDATDLVGENERVVLEALGWEPATLDDMARRTHLGVPTLVIAVESLIGRGLVERERSVLRRIRPSAAPVRPSVARAGPR